jgi:hypothetical protein
VAYLSFFLFLRVANQSIFNIRKMDKETVQPNSWAALRLPNETYRILQIVPNT